MILLKKISKFIEWFTFLNLIILIVIWVHGVNKEFISPAFFINGMISLINWLIARKYLKNVDPES